MAQIPNLANLIHEAETIIILCGAGMGVDSGLSTFRGTHAKGWKHSVTGKDIDYYDICQGELFDKIDHPDSPEAMKFWNHCRHQYLEATPHEGYHIIMNWVKSKDYFVYTTNVDHHWARVGVPNDKLLEIHGSVNKLQCCRPRNNECMLLRDWDTKICPSCNGKLRPNILMFSDRGYVDEHQAEIKQKYKQFIADNKDKKVVILTIGAGNAVPTISVEVNLLKRKLNNVKEIVINPDKIDSEYCISKGALAGLADLNECMKQSYDKCCFAV
jgi:NAD-dependent SIR2 family protein deacetylase